MDNDFKSFYDADIKRYGNSKLNKYLLLFHYFYRKYQFTNNRFLKIIYRIAFRILANCRHIEISADLSIGKGLYLGHAYCITINPSVVIGCNCNIHKGVTIGQENRGIRMGTPVIGNEVWIGINSTIVGKITIGNDVLIAPNSYVNCDIPDHSVVLGNPCIIIHKDHATEAYINNILEER